MSSKNHRLIAVCGTLMLLLTVAIAMRSPLASTAAAPAPMDAAKAAPPAKGLQVNITPSANDSGCVGN